MQIKHTKKIQNHQITSDAYTFDKGFDICDYIGFDTFKQESTNLASDSLYKAAPYLLEYKEAKDVQIAISLARTAGIISKTNFIALGGSFACSWALKNEEKALNSISACSTYYTSLYYGISHIGMTDEFISQDSPPYV